MKKKCECLTAYPKNGYRLSKKIQKIISFDSKLNFSFQLGIYIWYKRNPNRPLETNIKKTETFKNIFCKNMKKFENFESLLKLILLMPT